MILSKYKPKTLKIAIKLKEKKEDYEYRDKDKEDKKELDRQIKEYVNKLDAIIQESKQKRKERNLLQGLSEVEEIYEEDESESYYKEENDEEEELAERKKESIPVKAKTSYSAFSN